MLSALSSAERQGPVTMRDLCSAEQVQPPTMTRIVAALVAAGLVVREADPVDGRVAWVKVTPEGRRLLERSRKRKEAYLARALRDLDERDLATLEAAAEILERFTGPAHEGAERP
jgi:DNA-binding MarR family transcriptional regulator